MKRKRIFLLAVLALFAAIASALAVSRHTRDQAPVRFAVTIGEGDTLTKTISCYDSDGDAVTLTVEDLPTGAIVGAQQLAPGGYVDPDLPPITSDAIGVKWYIRSLSWTPNYQQAGSYTIYIHAVDDKGDDDWVKYQIIVTNKNRPPVL
jgi:hypothetical protein